MTGARVLAHPQVVEYQTHVARQTSHLLRHVPSALGFEHPDGETTKPGDVFRAMAGADATAVLIIVPVDHVVATLDRPVPAVDPQHALRTGLFRRAAGEAVGDLQRRLARLLVRAVPLNDERLAHMRKIEIPVEFRGRPDLARFDASVVRRGRLDKMRLAAIPKIELQGFQKTGLVSFHRERVVGLALLDQVSRQFALGQQGIGTDIFPLNIDGIQQRDRRLDLVRAFDLFLGLPLYGQGTDFFWV